MDVTDTANNVNDAETNEMFDVVNSFVHVHNIEKFRINVNTNSVYFIIQIVKDLLYLGDMKLLEIYV